MRSTVVSFLMVVAASQMVLATGISNQTLCNAVLTDEGSAQIAVHTTTMSAPGGPASSTQTLTIDGKKYSRVSSGKYEQGITMKKVPLKYPSGSLSSQLFFVTVTSGTSSVNPIKEVLYNCVSKMGK